MTARDIILDALDGAIRIELAQKALTAMNIYGSFRGCKYHGFDYTQGIHIEVAKPRSQSLKSFNHISSISVVR